MSQVVEQATVEATQSAAGATQDTTGATQSAANFRDEREGVRIAQGRFLDELPGAVFAVMTAVWVISSFAGLFWTNLPADFIAHVHEFAQIVLTKSP
jgi:hypothetical protein